MLRGRVWKDRGCEVTAFRFSLAYLFAWLLSSIQLLRNELFRCSRCLILCGGSKPMKWMLTTLLIIASIFLACSSLAAEEQEKSIKEFYERMATDILAELCFRACRNGY